MNKSMEVLVLSDTHGRRDALARVMDRLNFRPAAVLFLGDGMRDLSVLPARPDGELLSLYAVAGNCDGSLIFPPDAPEERTVMLGDLRVLMMHGHTHGVRRGPGGAICHAAKLGADVLLFGHTHLAYEATLAPGTVLADGTALQKPLLVANPGSLGEPRDGGGPSFGVLTIRNGQALFSHGRLE